MALDLTKADAGLVAVAIDADKEITLDRQKRYALLNLGANPAFGSTDGVAVVADDTEAAHKLKLLGSAAGFQSLPVVIMGVGTLKLKSTGGATVVQVSQIGTVGM